MVVVCRMGSRGVCTLTGARACAAQVAFAGNSRAAPPVQPGGTCCLGSDAFDLEDLGTRLRSRSPREKPARNIVRTKVAAKKKALRSPPMEPAPENRGKFYLRTPSAAMVPFNSKPGKAIFRRALEQGMLDGSYWSLSECFAAQTSPASCGLGTLAMCLNSLAIDPGNRSNVGIFRWYTEKSLFCHGSSFVPTHDEVLARGISMMDLCRLGACNCLESTPFCATGPNACTEDDFRRHVIAACADNKSSATRIVASYHRGVLGQTGDGHHSPIAAYDRESDRVLILDVARFKYAPHWVPLPLLWQAMSTFDTNGGARGFIKLARLDGQQADSCIDCKSTSICFCDVAAAFQQRLAALSICDADAASIIGNVCWDESQRWALEGKVHTKGMTVESLKKQESVVLDTPISSLLRASWDSSLPGVALASILAMARFDIDDRLPPEARLLQNIRDADSVKRSCAESFAHIENAARLGCEDSGTLSAEIKKLSQQLILVSAA